MSPDHVLSLVYCAFCALLLLTLIGIIFKILSKEKDSRDMYSIFTFLFMIMMLSIRTATIYPIVANNENFNDYESKCSETIFAGIPLSFFSLSILIHTFRWIMLKIKLSSGKSHSKVSAIFIISTVAISFGNHIFGVCLLCTDNKLSFLKELYVFSSITMYCIIHIALISFNIYLFLSFTRELSNCYPILYNKIKLKLSFYYIFMIILLIIRLIAVIPMYVDFMTGGDLIVPAYETLVWLISEILPILVMMFSFINFGSSSKDDIESLEERSSIFMPSTYNNSVDVYTYMREASNYNTNKDSQSESENSKEKEILRFSFSECKRNERDNTTINPIESITSTDSESNDEPLVNQKEYYDRATLSPMQKVSVSPIEEDIFQRRESNLKGAFRQMIADIGVDRPSQITLSALNDDE